MQPLTFDSFFKIMSILGGIGLSAYIINLFSLTQKMIEVKDIIEKNRLDDPCGRKIAFPPELQKILNEVSNIGSLQKQVLKSSIISILILPLYAVLSFAISNEFINTYSLYFAIVSYLLFFIPIYGIYYIYKIYFIYTDLVSNFNEFIKEDKK